MRNGVTSRVPNGVPNPVANEVPRTGLRRTDFWTSKEHGNIANKRTGKEQDLDQDFIPKAAAGQIRLGMKYALVTSG